MNNIPAFPLHNHGTQSLGLHFTGMTLRDYFAAKAMQALIMRNDYKGTIEQYAEAAYNQSDAMLKAREQ